MSLINVLFDYRWVILFYSAVILFVYLNRNKLHKEASLVYLYKTKLGLNLMEKVGRRFRKLVQIGGYVGILVAYAGFIFITFTIIMLAYQVLTQPAETQAGVSPVLPGLPIAGLGITFPLIIGWISIFIIMIVHEFAHGVVAKAHNVKIKSSGIAIFGPIFGAFVEPDEKQLSTKPHKVQHSVFAAGPVSNILLTVVVIALSAFVLQPAIGAFSEGVRIQPIVDETLPLYSAGIRGEVVLSSINGVELKSFADLNRELETLTPGDEVTLVIDGQEHVITTAAHPEREGVAYVGLTTIEAWVMRSDTLSERAIGSILLWLNELFFWVWFISINIGLINLFPIFITDGAQMLRLNSLHFVKNKEKALKIWKNINTFALILLLVLFWPFFRGIFLGLAGVFIGG
jgi:membrane-associated protease RseP (regulator of RpoE activity)